VTLTYRGPEGEPIQLRLLASVGSRTIMLDPLFRDHDAAIDALNASYQHQAVQ
jgi:hypothetical protein